MTLGCSSQTTYTEVKEAATVEAAAVATAAAMAAVEAVEEGAVLEVLRLLTAFPKDHTHIPASNLHTESGCKPRRARNLGEESEKSPQLAY